MDRSRYRTSFYTDPVLIQLVLDTTDDKTKQMAYAYRLGTISDMESLDIKLYQLSSIMSGTEAISFTQWLHDVVVLLSRVGNRIFKLGRQLVETVTKQYEFITRMWEDRIQSHIDDIVDNHFDKEIVSICSKDILFKRIRVIGRIHQLIENVESIINNPIHDIDESNNYNTPEFIACYKDLKEIGFNISNKTFTESRSEGYSSKETKATISAHGYSKSDLPDLISLAKSIANTATKKWLNTTVIRFQTINKQLQEHEKITLSNKALSDTEREDELKKVSIKISRLWWMSNFIHVLNQLSDDCMKYILKIFRAADDSIPQAINPDAETVGGNKYYF